MSKKKDNLDAGFFAVIACLAMPFALIGFCTSITTVVDFVSKVNSSYEEVSELRHRVEHLEYTPHVAYWEPSWTTMESTTMSDPIPEPKYRVHKVK